MTFARATAPTSGTTVADADEQKKLSYESAATLMAHGPHVLHEHIASKPETTLDRALSQVEVRFSNLSLSVDVVVFDDESSAKLELPTLVNSAKKSLSKLLTKKHVGRKEILKNVSDVFKPGMITFILGQPGSDKSSLMKILSTRFPLAKNITVEGEVTYNGVPQQEIVKRLPQFVAYVNQRDKHFPTLTVKETFEFVHSFCGGELSRRGEELLSKGTHEENLAALAAAKALFEYYLEIIIQQLGLENCQDTIVGNAMLRGVSGGERKRMTTGEMEFGMKNVTLMDEVSAGLDSAATYDIVRTQRSIAKKFRKAAIIALLQPAPEVFALFDDVIIMNDGEVMYHGPRAQAVDYFESPGFVCPLHRDVTDFLLDLGTNQQYAYQVAFPASAGKHPRYAHEFTEIFRHSAIYKETLEALEAPLAPGLLANVDVHMDPMPEFHQSFWGNTMVLTWRQLMVMLCNTAFIKGRGVMEILMGLIYSSTFCQFKPANIQVVLGIMFQAILFLSLGQASQIPTYIAARKIFYKHRGANFFRTSAYVVACSVNQLPLVLAESMVFGLLVYWMCGFVATAQAYLVYLVLLVLTNLSFVACFFFLAAIAPDLHIAKPLSVVSTLFFVIFAGFAITKGQMPNYFIWIYWVNPIAWCLRAIAVNQYRSSKFDVCEYGSVDYCAKFGKRMAQYLLSLYDVPDKKSWIWFGMVFMVTSYVFFMFLAYLVLEFKRYESPKHTTLKSKTVADGDENYALITTPKYGGGTSPGSSSSTGDEVVVNVTASELNFTPVTVAFKDLWYSVPLPSNPKESIGLLKGISGYALPGSMTALYDCSENCIPLSGSDGGSASKTPRIHHTQTEKNRFLPTAPFHTRDPKAPHNKQHNAKGKRASVPTNMAPVVRPRSGATTTAQKNHSPLYKHTMRPHTMILTLTLSVAAALMTATPSEAADMNGSSAASSPSANAGESNNSNNNGTSTNSSASNNSPQQQNWMLLAVISVAVLFVLVLGMVSFVLLRRRKKLKETEELECEMTTNATKATQFIHGSISTLTRGENGTGSGNTSGYHPEFEYLPNDIRTDEEMQPFRLQQKEVVRGRMIAKGGYGAVYKAKFRNETVVVKQLLPDKTRNKQILKSFMDEIRICAALDHPKVVRFIGVTWSSLLDLSVVMEYMANGDLGSLLTEQLQRQASGAVSKYDYGWFQTSGGTGSAKCKSLIALDVAEALVYLHSFISPIIHRDLKSRNVLLSQDWEAKLTDFGVSRELDEDQTMTGEIGTVSWIAPEVLRGERYTEKADIYSFGVIMTELDTCRRPYSDGIPNEENGGGSNQHTNTRIAVLVSNGSLKPSINDDCPPSVRRLINQCLELDPKNRPSAVQIHFELRNLDVAEEQRRETATIKRSGSSGLRPTGSGSSFSTRVSSKSKSGSR